MMIKRYFGSKRALFLAALEYSMTEPAILSVRTLQADNLPHAMATAMVDTFGRDKAPLDGFSMMLRSVANPAIMEIGCQVMERDRQKGLASVLRGPLAEERAALMLAMVTGFQMVRQLAGVSALADARPEALVSLLTAVLDALAKPPCA